MSGTQLDRAGGGHAVFRTHQPGGPVKYDQVPGSIGVLEAIDKPMPIGEAHCMTWDEHGLAVWTIRIGKQEIAGRWIIIDRELGPRNETASLPRKGAGRCRFGAGQGGGHTHRALQPRS